MLRKRDSDFFIKSIFLIGTESYNNSVFITYITFKKKNHKGHKKGGVGGPEPFYDHFDGLYNVSTEVPPSSLTLRTQTEFPPAEGRQLLSRAFYWTEVRLYP